MILPFVFVLKKVFGKNIFMVKTVLGEKKKCLIKKKKKWSKNFFLLNKFVGEKSCLVTTVATVTTFTNVTTVTTVTTIISGQNFLLIF